MYIFFYSNKCYLPCVKFGIFHPQGDRKTSWIHINSFTVTSGGRYFNKDQRWPETLSSILAHYVFVFDTLTYNDFGFKK